MVLTGPGRVKGRCQGEGPYLGDVRGGGGVGGLGGEGLRAQQETGRRVHVALEGTALKVSSRSAQGHVKAMSLTHPRSFVRQRLPQHRDLLSGTQHVRAASSLSSTGAEKGSWRSVGSAWGGTLGGRGRSTGARPGQTGLCVTRYLFTITVLTVHGRLQLIG